LNLMMLSAVCKSQVTKFLGLSLNTYVFYSCYISGNRIFSYLIKFWKMCAPMI
jgi:hypothetical protein